ncbi:thioesterase family protein [Geobacter sp.]|uniref:acyl-CoA thioesterase n=1 Tax=Geobacter sp. TaxID=46610 RepID=UPI00260EEEBB|nr:acyl-CoA thioesterase [Geobacter sp.]
MGEHETPLTVRFNEVDSYGVAWHGHYVGWMEVGRNELAGRFGLDAARLAELGYLAPVVELELKYRRPARYNEMLRILTTSRRTETATLEFSCRISAADGTLCATGRTVHALTDRDGVLQYRFPAPVAPRLEQMLAFLEG